MTKEELIHKINDLEWEDFEAKEAKSELPKNIWETVSAFANTSGGWIVLGIKQIGKKFEVCGVDNIEKLEQDFLGTLRGQKFNIKLSASAYKYDLDGKKSWHSMCLLPLSSLFITIIRPTPLSAWAVEIKELQKMKSCKCIMTNHLVYAQNYLYQTRTSVC